MQGKEQRQSGEIHSGNTSDCVIDSDMDKDSVMV